MNFAINLLVMAGITYLIRMVPLVLVKEKIKTTFTSSKAKAFFTRVI